MKLIDKYIFKSITPNFLLGILIFSLVNLIQFLYDLVSFAIEHDIPTVKIFTLLFYILPFVMTFTIPIGVLMGVLLTMGELSGNYEIVAMRTNGLPMINIFRPAVLFGVMVMVFHLFFFQYILPWGNKNYVITKYELLRRNPTLEIASKKKFIAGDIEIQVERTDTKKQIFHKLKIINNKDNLLLIAEEGFFLQKDEKLNAFPLVLKNVIGLPYIRRDIDKNTVQDFYHTMTLYINDFDIKKIMPRGAEMEGIIEVIRNIKKVELANIVAEMKTYHNAMQQYYDAASTEDMMSKTTDANQIQSMKTMITQMKLSAANHKRDALEKMRSVITPKNDIYILHRKFSYAVCAILMALLASPLGIINKRKGKEIAFGFGILMYVVYNSLLTTGNFAWQFGYMSPIAGAWLPNMVIALIIVLINYLKIKKM